MKKIIAIISFLPLLAFGQPSSASYQADDNGSFTSGGYSSSGFSQNFIVNTWYEDPDMMSTSYDGGSDMPSGFLFQICNAANPPSGLMATLGASSVTLSWDTYQGAEKCQVRGKPISAPGFVNLPLITPPPFEAIVPGGVLTLGETYVWQVRCACSISPLDVSGFSPLDTFTIPLARFDEISTDLQIDLFPNPANDIINVEIQAANPGSSEIIIYNAMGGVASKSKRQILYGQQSLSIDLGNYGPGIYYMYVQQANHSCTEKFIILR